MTQRVEAPERQSEAQRIARHDLQWGIVSSEYELRGRERSVARERERLHSLRVQLAEFPAGEPRFRAVKIHDESLWCVADGWQSATVDHGYTTESAAQAAADARNQAEVALMEQGDQR